VLGFRDMNPTLKAGLIGFVRAIGVIIIGSVLTYVGHADNLTFLSPTVAALVAGLALALENAITAKTGSALFGAVRRA
jgi:hypothetical protein